MAGTSNTKSVSFPVDLAGVRFGRLIAMHISGRTAQRHFVWACRCDCGVVRDVGRRELVRGNTRSCGCLRRECVSLRRRGSNYGQPRTRRRKNRDLKGLSKKFQAEYDALKNAISRCHQEMTKRFSHYGARGIAVCDRWRFGEDGKPGFLCFLEDMGARPKGLTLDRIDNDGNYAPDNCRWATWKVQAANQRRAKARA